MPTEEAKFLIKGAGYDGFASVSLIVDYDSTHLFAPHVTVAGGTLLQATVLDQLPGRLHLNIQTDDQSPAFEACLFFQKQGEYPAVINFVTAEIRGPNGTQQPIAVEMLANPNLPRQNTAETVELEAESRQLPAAATRGHKQ